MYLGEGDLKSMYVNNANSLSFFTVSRTEKEVIFKINPVFGNISYYRYA